MRAKRGFLVRFTDVGALKKCWEERIPRPINEDTIEKAVRRSGALLSRGIKAVYSGDSDYFGHIYVGGLRRVGSFEVVMGSEVKE